MTDSASLEFEEAKDDPVINGIDKSNDSIVHEITLLKLLIQQRTNFKFFRIRIPKPSLRSS